MGLFDRIFGGSRSDAPAAPAAPDAPAAPVAAQAPPAATPVTAPEARGVGSAVGTVLGQHFTFWGDEVDQLIRDGELDEALTLVLEIISAGEKEARARRYDSPPPGWTTKAAIIYRKLKRPEDEVAVIERYMAASKVPNGELVNRLAKARDLVNAQKSSEMPLSCPACGMLLDVAPKSKGTCQSCGSAIVVKSIGGHPRLFTPEQAAAFTADDKAIKLRRKLLLEASKLPKTEKDWDAAEETLRSQFGSQPNPGDVFWRLANDTVVELGQKREWHALSRTYVTMQRRLIDEGRDWTQLIGPAAETAKVALSVYDGPSDRMILLACSCAPCQTDHLRTGTVESFQRDWPLQHANCEKPPCRCSVQRENYLPAS